MSRQVVYVVTSGSYSDYGIEGIFSNRKNAEEFMKKSFDWPKDFNDVEEKVLDKELEQTKHARYGVGVMLDDGSEVEKYDQEIFDVPESRTYVAEKVPIYGGRGVARAESHKSAAHAKKLAVEARQKWLREKK